MGFTDSMRLVVDVKASEYLMQSFRGFYEEAA